MEAIKDERLAKAVRKFLVSDGKSDSCQRERTTKRLV